MSRPLRRRRRTSEPASFRLAGQVWCNVNIVAIRRGRRARGLAWSHGAPHCERRFVSCTAEIITGAGARLTRRARPALAAGRSRRPGGASVSHATRPGLPAAGQTSTIAGYRLDGHVGQGSRAVVYLARDVRLRRRVALKVMTPELARDSGFGTRMISESRAAAALGHPHIVPVFEADEADGILYAAMRYVTGGDTRSLLSRHGPLPLGYAWRIVAQLASALDAAHAHGVIHRDVRPANILLDGDDAGGTGRGQPRVSLRFRDEPGLPARPGHRGGPGRRDARLPRARADRGPRRRRPDRPVLAGVRRVRVPVRHAAVRPRPGPDPDVRADLRGPSGRERAARRNTLGGRLGAGHRAGEGPGRPIPELRPVRRGTACRARPAARRASGPTAVTRTARQRPRQPARPASAGRGILRVKERQRPGAEDEQAAAKDSHAVAADRPAGAGSLEPAPADDPAGPDPGGADPAARSGRPDPGGPDPGGPIPNGPPGVSAPAGPCWRPVP